MTVRFNHSAGGTTRTSPPNAGRDAVSKIDPTEGALPPCRRVTVTSLMRYLPHTLIGSGAIFSLLWTAALFRLALLLIGGLIPR
jgi:hypothetical protein